MIREDEKIVLEIASFIGSNGHRNLEHAILRTWGGKAVSSRVDHLIEKAVEKATQDLNEKLKKSEAQREAFGRIIDELCHRFHCGADSLLLAVELAHDHKNL